MRPGIQEAIKEQKRNMIMMQTKTSPPQKSSDTTRPRTRKIRCEVCAKRAANCLVRYHPTKWTDKDDAFWKFTCNYCIDKPGAENGIIVTDQCSLRQLANLACLLRDIENRDEFLVMLVRAHNEVAKVVKVNRELNDKLDRDALRERIISE